LTSGRVDKPVERLCEVGRTVIEKSFAGLAHAKDAEHACV